MRLPSHRFGLCIAFVVLAVVSAGCDAGADQSTTTAIPTTTSTLPPTTTTTEPPPPFIYRIGLTEAPITDNYWAFFDPQSTRVDQYILDPTKPSLYTYDQPGLEIAADLASGPEPPQAVEGDDGTWSVTVDLDPEATWSDGVPITSADIVFTWETVRELDLARGWVTAYPVAGDASLGLEGIESRGPGKVVLRFNARPGVPLWPNGPGTAPIMPRHFWEPILEEARLADDPRTAFLTASAAGEPSGGPLVIEAFGRDRVEAAPNTRWHRSGLDVESAGVAYELGPFFDALVFEVFDDPEAAVQALDGGQVDIVLSPGGLDRSAAELLASNPHIETVVNETNGFRYLAFNLRSRPMSEAGFRDAMAMMVDKEFLARDVLAGQVSPRYATIPPGNLRWFDSEQASSFAAGYEDLTIEERLDAAVRLLEEAGFGWARKPAFVDNAVVAGEGVSLEGEPVTPLRIIGPGASFDPFRSTSTLWIAEWATLLGFETEVTLTDFSTLVDRVFTPSEEGTLDFDMYVLGWRLPSPAIPIHHESLWASWNDTATNPSGNNNTGYADRRFDELVETYNRAESTDAAMEILWQMERAIFEAKPYILLFDSPITEAYRTDTVRYPFTSVLSGIQGLAGMPAMVRPHP